MSLISLLYVEYTKSFWYFLFISICAGIIGIELFFISTEKQGLINLAKTFLLLINIILSNQIVFPNGIALPDFYLHFHIFILSIVQTGFIPDPSTFSGNYEYFPLHHIFSSISIILINFNPKSIYLYIGGFLVSSGVIFIYLIGRIFFNYKFGLLSALLFTCLDYYLMYGSHPEHQAYNYAFSLIFYYMIINYYNYNNIIIISLCIIYIIVLIFMHHLTSILILISIFSLFLTEYFYKNKKSKFISISILKVYIIVLLLQWIYYSNLFKDFVNLVNVYIFSFLNPSEKIISPIVYDSLHLNTIFLNTLGSSILISIAIIGFIISFKYNAEFKVFLIINSIGLVFLLGLGIFYNIVGLLPDRIYPALQVFCLVFLAVDGFVFILKFLKDSITKFCFVFIIITIFSFFSCSSTISGFETSLFVDDSISYFKLYVSSHELSFEQWNKSHIKDIDFISFESLLIRKNGDSDKYHLQNKIIMFNKHYLKTGFVNQYGGHMGQYTFLKPSIDDLQKLNGLNKFYDNSIITLYT